jgi:hypothetical protein
MVDFGEMGFNLNYNAEENYWFCGVFKNIKTGR